MKLFIYLFSVLSVILLTAGMAVSHDEDNTDNWGYIRVDNHGAFALATKCYDSEGNGGTWRTTYSGHFRSCHGAYVRIDIKGGGGTQRIWRKHFHCGTSGMYVNVEGTVNTVSTGVSCDGTD